MSVEMGDMIRRHALAVVASGLLAACYGSHGIAGLAGSPDGGTGPDAEPDAPHDPAAEPGDTGPELPSSTCGNGILEPGEECDDGNDDDSDACPGSCRDARCGDGYRWEGHERCDGSDLGGATCASLDPAYEGGTLRCSECLYDVSGCMTYCGNGVLDPGEACDDGNDVPWDGCGECAVVEVLVNTVTEGDQMYPAVAMGEDGLVVVWQEELDGLFDIVGQRFGATGSAVGGPFPVSQHRASDQIHPAIDMNAEGEFVVVWQSFEQDGDGWGVFGRRFQPDGRPLGDEFRINEHPADDQTKAAVAMDGLGGFAVAWESDEQDGSDQGVFARLYGLVGAPPGEEFRVNEHTRYSQSDATIAMSADGGFVVAWESFMQDGAGEGIFAKLFEADGTVERREFQVNTWVTRNQATPCAAMAPDGSFILVWKSEGQDGDGWGVFAREFAVDGLVLGEEFQVNSETRNNQTHPAVALAAEGRRVVAWSSMLTDGSGYGVYGRRLVSSGTPSDGEFNPNTFTADDQWIGALAMADDGRFAVVWSSYGMDGSGTAVLLQRYDPSGRALGAAPW
jgi:cysteine-rich repeat protein